MHVRRCAKQNVQKGIDVKTWYALLSRRFSAASCHVSIASDQTQVLSRSCKFRSVIPHSYNPALYLPLKSYADTHHHYVSGILPLIPGGNSASAFLAASTSSAVGSCGTSTITLGSFEREASIAARFCSMSAQCSNPLTCHPPSHARLRIANHVLYK